MHWGQPHVWREISRYSMRDELEISQSYEGGVNHFTLASRNGPKTMSHAEEVGSRSPYRDRVRVCLTMWPRTLSWSRL